MSLRLRMIYMITTIITNPIVVYREIDEFGSKNIIAREISRIR